MCGIKLKTFCLLFLVALAPFCYSLSEEEKQQLPDLSKNELIQIIMIYEKALNKIETEQNKKDQILNEREIELTKRENRQAEREASLVMRETLLAESLQIRKDLEKNRFWSGFAWGIGSGFVAGNLTGYGIRSALVQFQY